MKYLEIAIGSFQGYASYLWSAILNPSWNNYFYYLIALSLLVWVLEIVVPWRKKQPMFRKDFWLDAFYMFFNFFLFSLVVYNALSNVGVELFNDFLGLFGVKNYVALEVNSWPVWGQFLLLFIVADFIQWGVHVTLHRVDWMWQFHKVHHSVTEMGFAAHLRFHWMETVFYKTALYIPLTMIGFGVDDFFLLHAFTILIGHLNHANLNISWGPLKYVLNSPVMHIWHHAKELPKGRTYGMNYGISLSLWDYLFGTAHIPHDGRDIELGFEAVEKYPESFVGQMKEPFFKNQEPRYRSQDF